MNIMQWWDEIRIRNIEITVAVDDDNKPWFDADDIAYCLEYLYASEMYRDLPDEDVCFAKYGPGGDKQVFISKWETLELLTDGIEYSERIDCKEAIKAIEKWCEENLG
ncbi:BRO-N domain-containing protein [Devriesea agamarum]|uniref:hypothetical protein n=1 Tax=Devriesea agamarum TaxID=472569 RepID=UPI00071E5738|nr:hypothetical protein [Devriesea agamarum]